MSNAVIHQCVDSAGPVSAVDEGIKGTGKGSKKKEKDYKCVQIQICAALIAKLPSEILINLILGL